ncbi:MAG TPA: 1-(5-phosphoribosyl)-5-amino-4-imidazole-carboxylate carboxylase, partial [Acidimicrobiaceae bacterium]|nr:1-(5-phosphoribosyl)-5-amino-4-imidazole-carboxylate carboxylase [Acidimicrobiaceae bacterium]
MGVARVDHHRALRQGLPEAVYGPGKSPGDVAVIVAELLEGGIGPVVLTRADKAQVDAAMAVDDTATVIDGTAVWRRAAERSDRMVVATAGTADRPVADECAAVLWAHGVDPHRLHDVGVSGLHRLLADIDVLL